MPEFRFYYFTPLYQETVVFYRDMLGFELYRCWDEPDGERGTIFRAPGGAGLIEIEAGGTRPVDRAGSTSRSAISARGGRRWVAVVRRSFGTSP